MSLLDRVNAVIGANLKLDVGELPDATSPAELEAWDSLAHVMVMVGLEQALEISISEDEMEAVGTLGDVRRLAYAKLDQPYLADV